MPSVDINPLAVLVCTIIYMVLGALWYSPLLFANRWMALMGKSQEEMQQMDYNPVKLYGLTALGALIQCYILAHIVYFADANTIRGGIETGFFIWLGFVAVTNLNLVLFEGRSLGLYIINNGYHLVALVLAATILSLWK